MSKFYKKPEIKIEELKLPDTCFRYRGVGVDIENEQKEFTPVTKLEWTSEGIFITQMGAEYKQKGLPPDGQTMFYLNTCKRMFVEATRLLSKWYFFPGYLILAVLPWKFKKKAIEQFIGSYVEITWRPLSPFMLKNEYMTKIAREMEWAVYTFLDNLGVKPELCGKFSEVFASIIELDNFYRYIMGDIFLETTKTAIMKDPVGEMMRLLGIMRARMTDGYGEGKDFDPLFNKFKLLVWILRIALLHPKIRKAFKVAITEIDIRKMALDEADQYWVCLRRDYKFLGKTTQERLAMLEGKSLPILTTREGLKNLKV